MRTIIFLLTATMFLACNKMPEYNPERHFQPLEKELLATFMLAEDSATIELGEGHFQLSKSLILDGRSHVTIKGEGMEKTVISFKGQQEGAEGIKISNCKNITLEDFSIEDAAGDNIKVTDTDGVVFRRVKSGWTGAVKKENGAYGLYPVICKNVLVEQCEVLGASDAGIYVGQSENVVIRNNKVYWNVAGIESENSANVEIYGNEATENTGGILVFDLPGLTRYGENIKVFDNNIYENNLENFAPAGNIVALVPAGTGLLILATKNVEAKYNTIRNNKTVGAGVISYLLVDGMTGGGEALTQIDTLNTNYRDDPNYDPYPGNIYLHHNTYENKYKFADLGSDFGKLFLMKFGLKLPHVVWDGIMADDFYLPDGTVNDALRICVDEAEEVKTATLDAANDFEGLTVNPEVFKCDDKAI